MNTRKQVLIMTALILMSLMILGVYSAWYPYREDDAAVHFEERTAERGAILFARNCRTCHGDVGEGGAVGQRLPAAPALNRADLQGFVESGGTLVNDIAESATTIQVSDGSKLKDGQTIRIGDERMLVDGVSLSSNTYVDTGATLDGTVNQTENEFRVSNASKLLAGQIILLSSEQMIILCFPNGQVTCPTAPSTEFRVLRVRRAANDTNPALHLPGERVLSLASDVEVERGVERTEAGPHAKGSPVLYLDPAVLTEKQKLITNTITCGRVGTPMPAWAQTQGGPLSEEQIRQLMVLISLGYWDVVHEEVDREDLVRARLTEPIGEIAAALTFTDISAFTVGEVIRMGDERMRLTTVPKVDSNAKDKSGTVFVQRGVLGTVPLPHDADELVHKFPETADKNPAPLQQSCGQIARAPAPVGTPTLIEPFTGQTVDIIAKNVLFDKKELAAKTGGQIRVRLDNQDVDVDHNIAFYTSSTGSTPVSPGSIGVLFKGPGVADTAFAVPAAGNYFFRCDVHPTIMTGTFAVTP